MANNSISYEYMCNHIKTIETSELDVLAKFNIVPQELIEKEKTTRIIIQKYMNH